MEHLQETKTLWAHSYQTTLHHKNSLYFSNTFFLIIVYVSVTKMYTIYIREGLYMLFVRRKKLIMSGQVLFIYFFSLHE